MFMTSTFNFQKIQSILKQFLIHNGTFKLSCSKIVSINFEIQAFKNQQF